MGMNAACSNVRALGTPMFGWLVGWVEVVPVLAHGSTTTDAFLAQFHKERHTGEQVVKEDVVSPGDIRMVDETHDDIRALSQTS